MTLEESFRGRDILPGKAISNKAPLNIGRNTIACLRKDKLIPAKQPVAGS
jgi:hypothetical protein